MQRSGRASAQDGRPGSAGPAVIAFGIACCAVAIILVLGVAAAVVI